MTDNEYQIMRNASLAIIREIGVETGGSNIQFAVNPENGKMVVIEMNPESFKKQCTCIKSNRFSNCKNSNQTGYWLHS